MIFISYAQLYFYNKWLAGQQGKQPMQHLLCKLHEVYIVIILTLFFFRACASTPSRSVQSSTIVQ